MYLYENMLAITNRKLCKRPFLEQVESLADKHPAGIILREKDLTEPAYQELAAQVLKICERQGITCILHTWIETAKKLGCDRIHLPIWKLRECAKNLNGFETIGVSIHSAEEAREACMLGATYLTAGHIFDTNCKPGTPGRGLDFLKEVCLLSTVPVYGIGGIRPDYVKAVMEQGAAGYCVMSEIMNMS